MSGDYRYDAQFERRIQQRRDLPYGDPQRLDDADEPLVGLCHDCWQLAEDCLCERAS